MRTSGLVSFLLSCSFLAGAQQASYFDPAQAYNRLLIEKNNGTYRQISNYKVTGSSYLFGEKNPGNIYATDGQALNMRITYDTYNQHIDFFPAGSDQVLTRDPGTIDSFVVLKNKEAMITTDMHFVYGKILGSAEKAYFQLIVTGEKVNLYKKYSAELGIVTSSIVRADLRQFDINVDYYYTDSTNRNLKKLKVNPRSLTKEFAAIRDLSGSIDADLLVSEKDEELVRIFTFLNQD